ncbi:hypothetical protein [Xenorhabdus bovienii]|uniref:hypothetical protein n=1 Tax=Xenorhabdus bovienii TaxID=40576 RepID=UPI0023B33B5D|nr:hypothetical protein [Xenorhabdus bovienii]MDE9455417.1 hypothetical protein [Xenorhabdus bovienii]
MTSNHWRSPGCFVPKDPIEKKRYLKELVFATMINNTPHPASKKLSERVNEERAGQTEAARYRDWLIKEQSLNEITEWGYQK